MLLFLGRDDRFGYADVVVPIEGADSDEVFADFAGRHVKRDFERVMLRARIGDLINWFNVLPRSRIKRVLGMGDG